MYVKACFLVGVLLLGLYGTGASAGKLYRWVDGDGVVHFTQYPPQNRKGVEKIELRPPPTSGPVEEVEEREDNPEKRGEAPVEGAQEQKKTKEIAALDRKNCEISRRNLTILEGGRPRLRDSDGNVRIIADEERKSRIEQARKDVDEFCTE